MSTAVRAPILRTDGWSWSFIALGLILLYAPTFYDLATTMWSTERQAHGPIVLCLALWFFWFKLNQVLQAGSVHPARPAPIAARLALGLGLVLYSIGRSQGVVLFEVGSLIPVLVGVSLMALGSTITKSLWFAFFFLLFVVPLPASIVDAVTQPMKLAVSVGAEHLLLALDLPVARSGVILLVGPYQLLVADACAGLNSLFTLEALGLLYMNVNRQTSVMRNALLAALIVPISYTSNVIRVLTLALITYYFGDEAGQGFLHGFSGIVLFLTALLLIVSIDALLRRLFASRRVQPEPRSRRSLTLGAPSRRHSAWLAAAMALTVIVTLLLTPRTVFEGTAPDLAKGVPEAFGVWHMLPQVASLTSVSDGTEGDQPLYDQTLMRSYRNDTTGDVVMLAVAWGRQQRQDVKVHRPDVCYPAQGFKITATPKDSHLQLPQMPGPITVRELVTQRDTQKETVLYWIRVGSTYGGDGLRTRLYLLREGLQGRVPDGILVRASLRSGPGASPHDDLPMLEQFLRDLMAATPAATRAVLAH